MVDVTALRSRVAGPVLTPADGGFAEEVAAWSAGHVHTPDVAVGVTSVDDVAEAILFARGNGLTVRVQGTGHGALFDITDGMLILTRRLDTLSVDPSTRIATVGAGVQWGAVTAAAAEHGLAPITGSSTTVGVVGYLTGGGLGPLARSHGFSSDYVRGFTAVTSDGTIVHANSEEHIDLYWALRGGKGGLAIITEVRLELVELATMYAGSLLFAEEHIETALRAWAAYTASADASVTTSAAILRLPDLPFIPEPIRGRTLLSLRFAYPGDPVDGERFAAPLRSAAPVYLDALAEIPASAVATIHGDPTEPSQSWTLGRMLTGIDQDAITAFLAHAGSGRQFPFVASEFRHLGNRTAVDVPGGSAVGGRSGAFTLSLIGAPDPSLAVVQPGAAAALLADIAPWVSPEVTINFASSIETEEEFAAGWPKDIFDRLATVRGEYDPSNLFAYGPQRR
jgi:FAD/FMN-containing dehydrogenase